MEIRLVGNRRASETIQRLKKIGENEFNIHWIEDNTYDGIDLFYGVSNFTLGKDEQVEYFEDIVPNTLLHSENFEVINDYDLVIVKNPTRLMLWKDAKHLNESKYYYVKNKQEWRINYSYGKVRGVFNKNIGNNVFGKADITQWTSEINTTIREKLKIITKSIAKRLEDDGHDLKSFGLDIIQDLRTGEFLLLELNQANSMNETQCRFFLQGFISYIDVTERFKKIDIFLNSLDEEEVSYVLDKLEV